MNQPDQNVGSNSALNDGSSIGPNVLLRCINRCFCRGWHRLSKPTVRLPDGPLVLVGNHLCGLDPLLIQASVNRPLSFLMAREYYQALWYIRGGFDMVGAIPVSPGGANRQALRRAIELVRAGNALCIFPEGAANPPIPLDRIMPGAALIARAAGAVMIPFHVSGVRAFDHVHMWRSFYRRSHAEVIIGQAIELPEMCAEAGNHKTIIRDDAHVIRHAIKALSSND